MAKLGEAYVQVRADLKGFSADLDAQLKTLTTRFEKTLNKELGRKLGTNVGKGTAEGFKDSTKDLADDLKAQMDRVGVSTGKSTSKGVRRGFNDGMNEKESASAGLKRWLGSIVSTVEDGFSALPAELKALIGVGLLGAVVPAGAFLGGAFAAAVVAGTAGLGIALASQFEEVQDRWTPLLDGLREDLVRSASAFVPQILAGMDFIEERMRSLLPTIRSIFDTTAKFVGPLTEGTVDLIDKTLIGLNNGLQNLDFQEFASALITGFDEIGTAIGDAFDQILSNPDVDVALADLLTTIVDIVEFGGDFIDWAIDAWMVMRTGLDVVIRVWDAMLGLQDALIGFLLLDDKIFEKGIFRAFHAFDEYETGTKVAHQFKTMDSAIRGSVAATKAQEKALKELNRQLSDQEKLINDIISSNVNYEESIDRVTEGYKEHGASLKAGNEIGRDNITNIQNEINALGKYTQDRLKAGQLTEAQAKTFYDREIARIRSEHRERGGNIADFNKIFNLLISINGIPLTPPKLVNLTGSANAAENALIRAKNALLNLNGTPIKVRAPGQPVNIPHYADGGFINSPQIIAAGEGYKKEVVLPLTNPTRSMQLLSQSPLAGMLGNATNVAVYIGDEQLNSRMFRVAQDVNRQAARMVNQGPRMV